VDNLADREMTENNRKRIIVVGAGIAGLTLAYRLSRAGYELLVVEKEGTVGGLAKSFAYEGGYIFDAGPHRFYTEDAAVLSFIHEVLEDDYLTIGRRSGVRMFDKYFEWPLKITSLLRMPMRDFFSIGLDLLRRERRQGESFEDYIIGAYGRRLYEIFFKPYTEKFLGMPCHEISKYWAVTGIDRAVIDGNIKVNDLFALAKSLLNPQPSLEFIYPKSGGIGVFAEKLKKKIVELGGRILLDSEVGKIVCHDRSIEKVVVGDREYDCDMVIWTGSLGDLTPLLGIAEPDLQYLSLILYNYCVDAPAASDYQWCYFGADNIPFNRVSYPTRFNQRLAPHGKSGVCVEVTCRKGDLLWQAPESIEGEIRKTLIENRIIGSSAEVVTCHMERIGNAYPIYSLNYADLLAKTMAEVTRFSQLELVGRTGTFWYNNMDHSIDAALRLSDKIIANG
jgi:protoporphyrinogen oxidase